MPLLVMSVEFLVISLVFTCRCFSLPFARLFRRSLFPLWCRSDSIYGLCGACQNARLFRRSLFPFWCRSDSICGLCGACQNSDSIRSDLWSSPDCRCLSKHWHGSPDQTVGGLWRDQHVVGTLRSVQQATPDGDVWHEMCGTYYVARTAWRGQSGTDRVARTETRVARTTWHRRVAKELVARPT